MKNGIRILFVLILMPSWASCSEESAQEKISPADDLDIIGYHEQPRWFKESFLDLQEDIESAAEQNHRVLYYFYQNGCPYCKKLLEVNFSQRDISEQTQKYFDVIAINIWGDREVTTADGKVTTEKAFARRLDVDFTPTLIFMNNKGETVTRLNGYYPPQQFLAVINYVGQKKENELVFADYWKNNQSVKASGKLHMNPDYIQAPFDLTKRHKEKPLLVLFEQKQCSGCDELHQDILQRKESQQLIAGFDVALFDIWSDTPLTTPAGKATTADQWAKALKIQYTPTLVLFDSSGREVFRTDAYLRAFHTQSALEYVQSGAYLKEDNFQRYLQRRADALEAKGVHVDIMN